MKKVFVLILCIFFYNLSYAQERQISGVVKDGSGELLPGVSVVVQGTVNGTITDIYGIYNVTVPDGATLVFSFIGMKTQEIVVGNQTEINVVLENDAVDVDEVVVVGYGSLKKSDLTGAVGSVDNDELTAFPTASPIEALQGRTAGVQVTNFDGEPGGDTGVSIRGMTSINAGNDPLYVVDGFVGGSMPNAEDIETMQVLKDASSTAIYGARAANGVIIITTKRAKEGKSRIEFNATYSFQDVTNEVEVMDATEFGHYINEVYANDNLGDGPFPNPEALGKGTDWQQEVQQTPSIQNYHIAFSGGEKVKYYVAGKILDQVGALRNSGFKDYSYIGNLDFDLSKKINIGISSQFSRSTKFYSNTEDVISRAIVYDPTVGIYANDGTYVYSRNQIGDPKTNPFVESEEQNNEEVTDRLQMLFKGNYDITRDLNFIMTLGINTRNKRHGMQQTSVYSEYSDNIAGLANMSMERRTNISNEGYFTYSKTLLEKHNVNAMIGYTYQTNEEEYLEGQNQNLSSDEFSYWRLQAGDLPMVESDFTDWTLSSYFARANYNFSGKYYLTFTGRYDGSSKFGGNNKWAFFPSAAVSWTASRETFLSDVDWLSQLKFRASHGYTGNSDIPSYVSLAQLYPTSGVENNQQVNAVVPYYLANPDLTWESTAQSNFGIDFGLFDSRLMINADYYYMLTSDLLYEVVLPAYSGYSSSWENIGEVSNKGIELSVTGHIIKGSDLNWTSTFNISKNTNVIEELYGGDEVYTVARGDLLQQDTHILREGGSIGSFYGYVQDGLYQVGDDFSAEPNKRAGQHKFKDINGRDEEGNLTGKPDGIIDGDDRTIIGTPHPDFNFGFNNTLKYKGFDLNVFFNGKWGGENFNYSRAVLEWNAGKGNSTKAAANGRWSESNPNGTIPIATGDNDPTMSSYYLEDASYIRLKNLSLGYSLPKEMIDKVGLDKVRISISGQNLFTITDYSGVDPEVSYRNSNLFKGVDYGRYLPVRSVTFGINVVL